MAGGRQRILDPQQARPGQLRERRSQRAEGPRVRPLEVAGCQHRKPAGFGYYQPAQLQDMRLHDAPDIAAGQPGQSLLDVIGAAQRVNHGFDDLL
jgi:hypothetical protein